MNKPAVIFSSLWVSFPTGQFDVVLLDPPWAYYGDPNKDQAAGKHYPLVSDADLKTLPVPSLLHKESVVFMWATSPRLDFAIELLKSWGLFYRGVAFVWVKTTLRGEVIQGQGVRPSIVKSTCEFVLAASRTEKGRPLPLLNEAIGQVIQAPRGEHSEKPEEVRNRINQMYGPVRKVELFARTRANCWQAWGNEILKEPAPGLFDSLDTV